MPRSKQEGRPTGIEAASGDERLAGGYVTPTVQPWPDICCGTELTYRIAMAAAELVDDVAGQAHAEAAAFEHGYRLGFKAGEQIGEGRTADAALIAQREMIGELLGGKSSRDSIGLLQRRWGGGTRQDFGQPRLGDHPGGPVDWDGRKTS